VVRFSTITEIAGKKAGRKVAQVNTMASVQATARVTVTIELKLPDLWRDDISMADIRAKATASALAILGKAATSVPFTIVGTPDVVAVIAAVAPTLTK